MGRLSLGELPEMWFRRLPPSERKALIDIVVGVAAIIFYYYGYISSHLMRLLYYCTT